MQCVCHYTLWLWARSCKEHALALQPQPQHSLHAMLQAILGGQSTVYYYAAHQSESSHTSDVCYKVFRLLIPFPRPHNPVAVHTHLILCPPAMVLSLRSPRNSSTHLHMYPHIVYEHLSKMYVPGFLLFRVSTLAPSYHLVIRSHPYTHNHACTYLLSGALNAFLFPPYSPAGVVAFVLRWCA